MATQELVDRSQLAPDASALPPCGLDRPFSLANRRPCLLVGGLGRIASLPGDVDGRGALALEPARRGKLLLQLRKLARELRLTIALEGLELPAQSLDARLRLGIRLIGDDKPLQLLEL